MNGPGSTPANSTDKNDRMFGEMGSSAVRPASQYVWEASSLRIIGALARQSLAVPSRTTSPSRSRRRRECRTVSRGSRASPFPFAVPCLASSAAAAAVSSILATIVQASIPCLTQTGTATFRTRPPFPKKIGARPNALALPGTVYFQAAKSVVRNPAVRPEWRSPLSSDFRAVRTVSSLWPARESGDSPP